MIKVMFAWRDHPEKSAADCERHYRTVHMGLARKAFDGVDGFVALAYNRVRMHTVNDYNDPAPIEKPTDIDAFVELWFEGREQLHAAFGTQEMDALFVDHANFMDCTTAANIRVYDVDEDVFFGRRRS